MRVAFVGNMNQHAFVAVRHLRKLGVAADLVIHGTDLPEFHPSYDTFDRSYMRYTRNVGWGDPALFSAVSADTVRETLAGYDTIVTEGPVPAFLHHAGLRAQLLLPFGDDLRELPKMRFRRPRRGATSSLVLFPTALRSGLREVAQVGGVLPADLGAALDAWEVDAPRRPFPRVPIWDAELGPDAIELVFRRSAWLPEIDAVRRRADVVLFHHSADPVGRPEAPVVLAPSLVDVLAAVRRAHADVAVELVILETAPGADLALERAEELGIKEHVLMLPPVPRKELLIALAVSDVVIGAGEGSLASPGIALDGLALGKTVIVSGAPEDAELPILGVGSPEAMIRRLGEYIADRALGKALAQKGRAFYEREIRDAGFRGLEAALGL